jgi:hypothetical protein
MIALPNAKSAIFAHMIRKNGVNLKNEYWSEKSRKKTRPFGPNPPSRSEDPISTGAD